ncbi:hypothetical protein CDAR_519851 [Caerostris darwini]|uniref:Uncharacterized protein n=1 Tax=Caerostris darwini TaxID=1538125 RepID=A0AAV4THY8_9ARAC|nr:hypothetical protein CDAR_519851 [Caerostris darwini]
MATGSTHLTQLSNLVRPPLYILPMDSSSLLLNKTIPLLGLPKNKGPSFIRLLLKSFWLFHRAVWTCLRPRVWDVTNRQKNVMVKSVEDIMDILGSEMKI